VPSLVPTPPAGSAKGHPFSHCRLQESRREPPQNHFTNMAFDQRREASAMYGGLHKNTCPVALNEPWRVSKHGHTTDSKLQFGADFLDLRS